METEHKHTLTRTTTDYLFDGKPTPWKANADAGVVLRWCKDRYGVIDIRYVAETVSWRVER